MKKLLTLAAAALLASSVANAADELNWYITGSSGVATDLNGNSNTGWGNTDECAKFVKQDDGTYIWKGSKLNGQFKIFSGTWHENGGHDLGYGYDGELELTYNSTNDKEYTIYGNKGNLKANNLINPIIKITIFNLDSSDSSKDTMTIQVIDGTVKEYVNWDLTLEQYNYFYFIKPASWGKACIYTWNDQLFGEWKAHTEMSLAKIGDKEIYVARALKTAGEIKSDFGLQFNDGSDSNKLEPSNPSADVVYDSNKNIVGYIVNGEFTTKKPVAPKTYIDATSLGITDPAKTYFIFDNSVKNWGTPKAYIWYQDEKKYEQLGAWSGTSLTKYKNTNYYYTVVEDLKGLDGLIFTNNGDNNGKIEIKGDDLTFNMSDFPVFNGGMTPSAYLAFPADVIITNDNVEGCFTDQEGVFHHDNHVAIHPNLTDDKSIEIKVCPSVNGNAFNLLAQEELYDHIKYEITPLFSTDDYAFLKRDKDKNVIYEKDENGEWYAVLDESAYSDPKFGQFEINNGEFSSHITTHIAGDYQVRVYMDDYTCNLIPFDKTFKVNIKPTIESLDITIQSMKSVKKDDTYCINFAGAAEKGLLTSMNIFSGQHVPTNTLKVYYKLTDRNKKIQHKVSAAEAVDNGYTLYTNPIDLTEVYNKTKNLSLIVEQNGSASGNMEFTQDDEIVTAVEGVEVEGVEAPARYFTLQGVEVSNLVPGIYIMVKGNVSSKILVK